MMRYIRNILVWMIVLMVLIKYYPKIANISGKINSEELSECVNNEDSKDC